MLVYDAIEAETKEKLMPLYLILKVSSMILKVEDKLPSFEDFIKKDQNYSNRDSEVVIKEYTEIAQQFRKARE